MAIKAITFDLDDTLWEIAPVITRAECALYEWLCRHYPRIAEHYSIDSLRALRQQIVRDNPQHAHNVTYLRKESLRRAAQQCGYDGDVVAEAAWEVFIEARHAVTMFDDVVPVLERLSTSYRLGVLSNGNADIARLGLRHLFTFSLSAVQVGSAKPDRAMFARACELFDVTPAELVHVGDHPEHDIQGASAAGLRTVWINRAQLPWPGGDRPDAEIRSLAELEALLQFW